MTRELVSALIINKILGTEYVKVFYSVINGGGTLILMQDSKKDEIGINAYELASLCKEWAFENGYYIESGKHLMLNWESTVNSRDLKSQLGGYFNGNSEPESIFKACNYIKDLI